MSPEEVRELAATLRVRFFFSPEYTSCKGCQQVIWAGDPVCIDQALTGQRHEDCADDHH